MKRRKIGAAITCIVMAVAALFLWGMVPRKFSQIYDIETDIINMTCTVTKPIFGENGETDIEQYALISMDEEQIWTVFDMLGLSNYRPRFRNLLPFALQSISASLPTEGTVIIDINNANGWDCIQILDSKTLIISTEGKKDMVYRAKNGSAFRKLMAFVERYGEGMEI